VSQTNPAELFALKVVTSLREGSFVRLVLSKPAVPDGVQRILGRAIRLRGAIHLSLTFRHKTQDHTENLAVAEVATRLQQLLSHDFGSALLGTTTRDWQFISAESGVPRLVDHKPAIKKTPSREHDRKKSSWLDQQSRDWLTGLGVLDREGRLRASMADKHRQIDRYLEIFSHLAEDCGWRECASGAKPVQCADMGCGKGYLTFGLWHLFHRVWQQPVKIIGVESRANLVAETNRLAEQIRAEGLEFRQGEILNLELPALDVLIALHACNTATDDALRRGVELGAKLIVVSPCCYQEVRPQLGHPEPLASVLKHGLMAERLAEWATDGLRALFLEWAGYRTKMIEFIGSEHTPKNLMIAAIKAGDAFASDAARKRILELKHFLGIQRHALDGLLERTA